MKLPLLLIVVSASLATVVAYGTYPIWMRFPHGLDIILWSRRLQWLLVASSIIACVLLIALAISGRRRAWWLIGLAPVLALFAHRFATGLGAGRMIVADNPPFLDAKDAKVADDEWIVGVKFGDGYYAYRYSTLFAVPVILQKDQDERMILMWSAFANRVLAMPIRQELKARDLEVVSTPANALLLYDSRRGEFINGFTGLTDKYHRPAGFASGSPLLTWKMPWKDWHELHPESHVLDRIGPANMQGLTVPIRPAWPMPPMSLDRADDTRVALLGSTAPIAVETNKLTPTPLNTRFDDIPVVIFRPGPDQPIRAFDRRTTNDSNELFPVELKANFKPKTHPHAMFVDAASDSGWNAAGVCVDAPAGAEYMKGKKLVPVAIDVGVPLSVLHFWFPDNNPSFPPSNPNVICSTTVTPPEESLPVEAEEPDPPHKKKKKRH